MKNEPNDPVLAAIQRKRGQLQEALRLLDEMEERADTIIAFGAIGTLRPKAPAGELRQAMIAAMKGAGPIMSAALKKKIVANGYSHHVNSQYFTKTLRALVEDKFVKKVSNGAYSTYELKRSA